MDQMLVELVDFLKQASPIVWQTLLKQVYVEAIQYAVWAVASVVLTVVCGKLLMWSIKGRQQESDSYERLNWGTGIAIFGLMLPISMGLAVSFTLDLVARLINPEYYAILLILARLGN